MNQLSPSPTLASLAIVSLHQISSFLTSRDYLSFSLSTKQPSFTPPLPTTKSILLPITSEKFIGNQNVYDALLWNKLDLKSNCYNVHSVTLSGSWCDQGWGNRKGMISVVTEGGVAPRDFSLWGPYVVGGAEPAPHEESQFSINFSVSEPKNFEVWVRVGGGGGHTLTISNLKCEVLMYGTE
ncbi:hypothetical protein ScalyP_jg8106 [Parmales sp. scaly parma]|nr:hypothetical protein ScalyP_jg8106 [Parmales sp. scaly parma]